MNPESVISKINDIRLLISANKISNALDELVNFANWTGDKNIQNSIILTCANFNHFRNEKMIGVGNDLTLRNSSIFSLLEILNEIEEVALAKSYKNDIELSNNNELTSEEIDLSYRFLLRDAKNYNLLDETQKDELYIRTLKLKKVMYDKIDIKFRNDYPNIIFNRIFFSKELDEIEIKELLSLPINSEYKWYEKNIVVSALSLSLINRFDITKIELLLNFINAFEDGVWQRALVGLTLGLFNREYKLLLHPKIIEKLNKLQEIKDIENGLETIFSELNRETYKGCYNRWGDFFTNKDFHVLRKVENWFLPFYPDNPILKGLIDKLPNIKGIELLPSLLTNDRHLSHSQKYVISLSLPNWNKNKIKKFINSLYDSQECNREHVFDNYIADFYWFFQTFPNIELENIFKSKIKIYETTLLDILIKEKNRSYVIGNIELDNKNFKKALSHFQETLKQGPTSHVYCRLGTAYYGLKKYKLSIQAQEKAFELDQEHFHSFQMMFSCYLKLKDWSNAFNCFEFLVKNEEAIFIYDEEIQKGEEIINELGVSLYQNKEYNKSQFVFEMLITQIDSNRLGTYYACLGYCYFLLNDNEKSIFFNNKAIEIENNPFGYKNLGHLTLSLGDIKGAKRLYFLSNKYFGEGNQFSEILKDDFEHIKEKISIEKYKQALPEIEI